MNQPEVSMACSGSPALFLKDREHIKYNIVMGTNYQPINSFIHSIQNVSFYVTTIISHSGKAHQKFISSRFSFPIKELHFTQFKQLNLYGTCTS